MKNHALNRLTCIWMIMGLTALGAWLPLETYGGQEGCPPIGAIRWDAWHGKDGKVGLAVERSLSPLQWHYRLPFCGRVLPPNRVEIECDSPSVMDAELRYAQQARLNYWAFLAYDEDDSMSLSYKYYRASPDKRGIHFAFIAQFRRWGGTQGYVERNRRFVEAMKDPAYQKVQGNRPLFFVFNIEDEGFQVDWGGAAGFQKAVAHLREEAKGAGVGDPFMVVMDFNPERAKRWADRFGFDAISTYATHTNKRGAPYSELAKHDRSYWERSKRTGASVVPIVMAGWDDRPRAAAPAPWQMKRVNKLGSIYFEPPRPGELAAHVGEAIGWATRHAGPKGPNPIIIYAWNENDEGGWLIPTLSEGSARVEAMGNAVRNQCK
jgi:hypothetical protein